MLNRTTIKWLVPFAVLVIIFAALATLIITMIAYREILVEVEVNAKAELDDKMAIAISREALQKVELLDPLLQPRLHRKNIYFARNLYNSNNGYVVWKWQDNRNPGYTVRIEREGSRVECSIGLNKS